MKHICAKSVDVIILVDLHCTSETGLPIRSRQLVSGSWKSVNFVLKGRHTTASGSENLVLVRLPQLCEGEGAGGGEYICGFDTQILSHPRVSAVHGQSRRLTPTMVYNQVSVFVWLLTETCFFLLFFFLRLSKEWKVTDRLTDWQIH